MGEMPQSIFAGTRPPKRPAPGTSHEINAEQLLVDTARAVLQLDTRVRNLEGAMYTCYRLAADHPFIRKAQAAKQEHDRRMKQGNVVERREAGPPHLWAAAGLLEALVQDERMKAHPAHAKAMLLYRETLPPLHLARAFPLCQVSVQHHGSKGLVKVAMAPEQEEVFKAFVHMMEQDAGVLLPGAAPRGPLMRKVLEGLGPQGNRSAASSGP